MLFLSGYGLELEDLKQFRQWGSLTPGHPEVGHTAGVEVTTGPLGQGFANAVGMAIAEANLRARFGAGTVNHHTFVVAGDGCLMEGVSHEAASWAGHLGLGHLVCIFDDNKITIDGPTDLTVNEDTAARFRSYGWDVQEVGDISNDVDALEAVLNAAKDTAQPTLIMLRTHIGYPSPDHVDTNHAHGNPFTAEDVTRTKAVMGIPDEPFWAPPELVGAYRSHVGERGAASNAAWQAAAIAATESPDWRAAWAQGGLDGWNTDLPVYEQGDSVATRKAIQKALDATFALLPGLMSGSADLKGSNGVALGGSTPFANGNEAGRYLTSACASTRWVLQPSACQHMVVFSQSPQRSSCSRTTCGRRFVWLLSLAPRSALFSRTTRSASAKTARPISLSSNWPRSEPSRACM